MAQFRKVTAARAVLASKSPALFAASSGQPGEAGRIAEMSPREAAVHLGKALNATSAAIERARPKITERDGGIDWREFTPIHQKLWDGMPAQSGLAWQRETRPVESAKDVIGEYHATEFWRTIGLASLGAAAFLFSEIATGGMATFLWAAAGTAGVMQAGFSIQKYEALATAAQTATSKDTQLVTTEQVSEAQAAAVLDTAFAFLDVFMAVKGAVGGVKAAASASRSAAREGLAGLAKLTGEPAAEAVRKAVRELGPQETLRRTAGIPVDDLVKMVGGEATAEGKALGEAAKDAAVVGLPALGPGGDAAITPAARELASKAHPVFEQWAHLTPQSRLDQLLELRNAELRAAGIPVPKGSPHNFDKQGETLVKSWEVWINDKFLGKTISEKDFARLVDTVTHETEHVRDMFGVAQMSINDGKTAEEVAQQLRMRPDVAQAAADVQNGARPGTKLVKGSTREAELREMWSSVWGPGRANRKVTLDGVKDARKVLNDVAARLNTAVKKAGGAEALKRGDPALDALVAEFKEAKAAHNAAFAKYKALAEEVTAFKAGDAAGAAMLEHFDLVREFKVAQTDLTSAAAAWDTSTAVLEKSLDGGSVAAYVAKVDNWNAYAKYMEALDEVRSTESP